MIILSEIDNENENEKKIINQFIAYESIEVNTTDMTRPNHIERQ